MCQVEIRVEECIDQDWAEWFEGFEITHPIPGMTLLAGTAPDQAALYGLIAKLRDLGLRLHSIIRLDVDSSETAAGLAEAAPFENC